MEPIIDRIQITVKDMAAAVAFYDGFLPLLGFSLRAKALGADVVSPPRLYPQHKPAGYYAVFFKDPDGIKYEIVTHDGAS